MLMWRLVKNHSVNGAGLGCFRVARTSLPLPVLQNWEPMATTFALLIAIAFSLFMITFVLSG
jgi:hypothetical protein